MKFVCPVYFLVGILLCCKPCIAQRNESTNKVIAIADVQYAQHGSLYKIILGKNYRAVWNKPVLVDKFYFKTTTQNFTPIKVGGGLQTVSLLITDQNNNEWSLRSVQKNPSKWLPVFWRKTFVNKIVQDQISASFPYGALIVPEMAAALNIGHATPKLVVINDDSAALGKLRDVFANRFVFLEERNPQGKSISTEKLLRLKDSLPGIIIDSMGFLKCRLLDIVIGDWDRHPDQFRWYLDNNNGIKMYKPIPNDRDQALFKSTGIISSVLLNLGFMRYLEGFDYNVRNIKGFMQRGTKLDKKILGRVKWEEIEVVTKEVMNKLSDPVLEHTLTNLPVEIQYNQFDILNKLISRRNSLPLLLKKYYKKVLRKANA